MERSSQNEKALLNKYLAGKCSPEEIERLETWYNSFDTAPLPGKLAEQYAVMKVKRTVLNQISTAQNSNRGMFQLSVLLKVAASVVLVGAISLIIYYAGHPVNYRLQEYAALNGEQKVIKLADGSVVTLNSGSVLQVRSDFTKSSREVSLSGEAYFQVHKDHTRPFIVGTGVIKTRVLGTAFNVQAYKNEGNLTVTVTEGKVRVDQDGLKNKQTNLSPGVTPGQQLVYNRLTQQVKVIAADAEHIAAWRKGMLYLDNESIPAIARKLERKYNIKIEVAGKINPECRYTLRISDETLAKTIEVLTSVSGITCKYNQHDHLIINAAACK